MPLSWVQLLSVPWPWPVSDKHTTCVIPASLAEELKQAAAEAEALVELLAARHKALSVELEAPQGGFPSLRYGHAYYPAVMIGLGICMG